jgi:hypothetical protein
MAKLGWGTPPLITLSLGIIIEIPGNLAILGVLKCILPDEKAPVLTLQVAFVGAIEFDKKRLWLFAGIFDSKILTFTIEGEMGVLFAWGDDANFVLSVGGFHPRFKPPPLPFPSPKRLAIAILDQDQARIRVSCYFAVTTNTVQFGAHAELFFGFSAISVEGSFHFDVVPVLALLLHYRTGCFRVAEGLRYGSLQYFPGVGPRRSDALARARPWFDLVLLLRCLGQL